jgi:phage terminase large subunit-like protein
VLNQRIEVSSPFIAKPLWDACSGEPMDFGGLTAFGGLDLSESGDLTAMVLIYNDIDALWHVKPTFWLPEERLHERAAADRVPYDLWRDEGYLETTPGAAISYDWVAIYLRDVFENYDVRKIAFDRWGMRHFKTSLQRAGFSDAMIKERFVEFGQGYQSMSPALRDLESLILERKIRHGGHPILSMCMANATVERDAAGNRKLTKRKSSGRIDGAVALVMAIGAAPEGWTRPIDVESLIG